MSEHYCQFSANVSKGSRYEFYTNFDEAKCCGAVAHFVIYDHYWMCAQHYDVMVAACGNQI